MPYIVEPMWLRDIKEVMEIEQVSFLSPWSARAYRHELLENDLSHYFVVRQRQVERPGPGPLTRVRRSLGVGKRLPILGYGGFWLMAGEAHISTIAVQPTWRRKGIGELLLAAMLDRAIELEAEMATLEVRASNVVAQNLYHKYGFQQAGSRRRYYRDNDEDALIMSTERLTSATFQSRFQALKRALRERLIQSLDKML
ncbi:MAG: ribosomal-protein-alanine N-acetyltransferase [Chloroflexi bacterium]|nr:ribosomal-protein-alanine N-acetyltransferase [Chloroflexota bacterium]